MSKSIAIVYGTIEMGVKFLNTPEVYGVRKNRELIGRAIRDRRDKVVLASS